MTGLVGYGKTLERICKSGRIVLRTLTEEGQVWTIDGVWPALNGPACVKLVEAGALLAREHSRQSFELDQEWLRKYQKLSPHNRPGGIMAHVNEIMGKRVKFTSGPNCTPYEGVVCGPQEGRHVPVKDDAGKVRKVFPGCCTVIG